MRVYVMLLLMVLIAPIAWAVSPPSITATQASVAVVSGQTVAAGYVTLQNTGARDLVLTGVSSDCCASVEMHEMRMQGDIMRMRALKTLAIPAGATALFSPGENHLMLIGLKKPPADGQKIPVTLHFADGSALPIAFTVAVRGGHEHE